MNMSSRSLSNNLLQRTGLHHYNYKHEKRKSEIDDILRQNGVIHDLIKGRHVWEKQHNRTYISFNTLQDDSEEQFEQQKKISYIKQRNPKLLATLRMPKEKESQLFPNIRS